ncbi:MAG: cytochrome c [Alphaproteobacteria bacterium]|nr:cytochrome c [Alphaproteobacteria bacterium]
MRYLIPLSFLAVLACGDKDTADDSGDAEINAVLALSGDSTSGESIYSAQCASCHGASGEGGVGPALSDEVPEHGDAELLEYIIYGEDTMPAFGQSLSDQEIADVLAYLNATWG